MFENEALLDIGEDEGELKAAEALLSKSGPNGTDYFNRNIEANKRQKTKTEDEPSDDNGNSSPANVNTFAGKEEDVALMTDLGWVKNKEEAETLFEYSNVGPLKIYDPNTPVSDNPFFSGAAISGGVLQQQNPGRPERKKGLGKKGRKNSTGGNKSRSKAKNGPK